MIKFQSVTKQYLDGTLAVEALDLSITTGRITVLAGPSGCGKTTAIRLINRMTEATAGSILLDGKDNRYTNPAALRRSIGCVFQHSILIPHQTTLSNIAMASVLNGYGRRAARLRAAELLELVGLPIELGHRYPPQLTSSQERRVCIARALAGDPPILLMDAPFSAVDPPIRQELQEHLLKLQHNIGKTIVFTTNDIHEALRLGDRIAIFRQNGELAQYAPPLVLLFRPADHFVASFLGKYRGYRTLDFLHADLPLTRLPCVTFSTLATQSHVRQCNEWVLVIDDARRPLGWLMPDQSAALDDAGTPQVEDLLPVGSVYELDFDSGRNAAASSLRSALDAALDSPAGLGIAVDGTGAVVGSFTAELVLAELGAARRLVIEAQSFLNFF